jgi:hypothetical protein
MQTQLVIDVEESSTVPAVESSMTSDIDIGLPPLIGVRATGVSVAPDALGRLAGLL